LVTEITIHGWIVYTDMGQKLYGRKHRLMEHKVPYNTVVG